MTNIEEIKLAAIAIRAGNVVAFPTETVYGLGADATNYNACNKIFYLKKRPANNPLIVHVSSLDQAFAIGDFSPIAKKIAQFWPGALTIIVKKKLESLQMLQLAQILSQ